MLSELASDRSPKVRGAVARNPSASVEVLDSLVNDERWEVRFAVAENPSPQAIRLAVGSSDPDVRGRAAQRDDLDAASIERLLEDSVHTVRERMGEVTRDIRAVSALARDPHPAVRSTILLNPVLGKADAEMLARDPIARVRATAAGSRRLDVVALGVMAEDRSVQVRWSVLVNNPERLDLARKLQHDSNETIADRARAQLERPRVFTAFLGDVDFVG